MPRCVVVLANLGFADYLRQFALLIQGCKRRDSRPRELAGPVLQLLPTHQIYPFARQDH